MTQITDQMVEAAARILMARKPVNKKVLFDPSLWHEECMREARTALEAALSAGGGRKCGGSCRVGCVYRR